MISHIKKFVPLLLLSSIMLSALLLSCSDEETKTYHHKIYKINDERQYTVWTVHEKVWFDGGFVCWKHNNEGNMCITGDVTVIPIENKIIIKEDGVETNGWFEIISSKSI